MALWILQAHKDVDLDYDCATGFVVRARSEERARTLAAKQHGDEGYNFWIDPHSSSCQRLGAGEPQQVILRSFRAA